MSVPTLFMTSQLNDSFNYGVVDPLSDTVQQLVNLQNAMKMAYGQAVNGPNTTIVVPTKFYLAKRNITIASSTLDIDLTLLTDIFGNVLNFSKVNYLLVKNNDASGGSGIIVKPGPSNGWTGPFNGSTSGQNTIAAGGEFRVTAPYVGLNVNSGSKILRLQNDAASPSGAVSVTIIVAGS